MSYKGDPWWALCLLTAVTIVMILIELNDRGWFDKWHRKEDE